METRTHLAAWLSIKTSAFESRLFRCIDALVPRDIREAVPKRRVFKSRIFASFCLVMLGLEPIIWLASGTAYGWYHLHTMIPLGIICILIVSYALFRFFDRELIAFHLLLFGGVGLYLIDLYNSGLIFSQAVIWAPIIVWAVTYYRGKNYALLIGGVCTTFVLCSWFFSQSSGSAPIAPLFEAHDSITALTEFVSAMAAATILSYIFQMFRDRLENEVEYYNNALHMASDALESKQALLKAILDTIPHCILVKNADGEVLKVNRATAMEFGRPAEFMEGYSAIDLASGDVTEAELIRQTDKEIVDSGETIELTMRRALSNGDLRYTQIAKTPLRDTQNSIVGMVELRMDVTEQVKSEQNARILERMEAIVQTIGGVCHTYNNKNQIILGYLHKIKEVGGVEIQKFSERIEQAVQGTTELNNQLLTYSRKTLRSDRSVLNPARLLGEILQERYHDSPPSITWDVRTDSNLHKVCVNRDEFIKAVNYILQNAQEALGGEGKIKVRAANLKVQQSQRKTRSLKPGDYVEISISDNGCGMTRADAKKAFEPFFTTKDPAVHPGLGLSNVFGIIKEACGTIEINSDYGKGTVVRAILPRASDVGDRQRDT